MRGKRYRSDAGVSRARITPAHAGKTRRCSNIAAISSDHPRACGENDTAAMDKLAEHGSPPRMRGKPPRRNRLRGAHRITPAHAGKTSQRPWRSSCRTDHPRACGENPSGTDKSMSSPGSPPRMRGKHFSSPDSLASWRITPAHAGKTESGSERATGRADHPRACGENFPGSRGAVRKGGSPPRMRGKLNLKILVIIHLRITPAHAGKT